MILISHADVPPWEWGGSNIDNKIWSQELLDGTELKQELENMREMVFSPHLVPQSVADHSFI